MDPLSMDVKTVITILVVGNVGSLIALLAYQGPREADRPTRLFMAGILAHAIGWALLAGRGGLPDLLSVYLGNALVLSAFCLEALAFASIEGASRRKEALFAGLALAGIAGFLAFSGSPNGRVAGASFASMAPFGALAAVMLPRRGAEGTSRLRTVVGATAALYGCILAARGTFAAAAGPDFGLMTSAMIQTLTFLPLVIFLLAGTIAFILLLKQEGDLRLRDSEEQYRSLVELASEAIVIVQGGSLAFANRRMTELVGIPAAELAASRSRAFSGRRTVPPRWPTSAPSSPASRPASPTPTGCAAPQARKSGARLPRR